MDQLDLSEFFTTRAQATDFSTRLASVSQQVYETGFDLEKALLTQFGIEKKDKFMTLIRDNGVRMEENPALQEFMAKVIEKTATLGTAALVLAFEPNNNTLVDLARWFMANINRQVVFEIKVDPSIIAGAAITFNGKYRDFSIKPKLDQLVAEALK
jgi:F0F1-type ATP synthase delta subunit